MKKTTRNLAALLAALEKLSADETAQTVLRLYDGDGVRYGGADTQAVDENGRNQHRT